MCTIANANGRLTSIRNCGGILAAVGKLSPVTAAASVPHSSTVMFARCTACWTYRPGAIPARSASGRNGAVRPRPRSAAARSRSAEKSQRGSVSARYRFCSLAATAAIARGASIAAGARPGAGSRMRIASCPRSYGTSTACQPSAAA